MDFIPPRACSDFNFWFVFWLFFGGGYHQGHLESRDCREVQIRVGELMPLPANPCPHSPIVDLCVWFPGVSASGRDPNHFCLFCLGGGHRRAHLRDRSANHPGVRQNLRSESGGQSPWLPAPPYLDALLQPNQIHACALWFFSCPWSQVCMLSDFSVVHACTVSIG